MAFARRADPVRAAAVLVQSAVGPQAQVRRVAEGLVPRGVIDLAGVPDGTRAVLVPIFVVLVRVEASIATAPPKARPLLLFWS